jgi:hypothetical protein
VRPAPGGEQRRIAAGKVKRDVAQLGHCLLHLEKGEKGAIMSGISDLARAKGALRW